jgi:Flp pilus assembly protein TadD
MHNSSLRWLTILLLLFAAGGGGEQAMRSEPAAPEAAVAGAKDKFAGSKSCGQCHEQFNKLWSTYWHGMSMRTYSDEFAKGQLTVQPDEVVIGENRYKAEIGEAQGWVLQQGPQGERRYPILHVLGGKNVFYFLTRLERGRLQVLPVAYDVKRHEWFDTTASAVAHLAAGQAKEATTLTPGPSPGADRRLVGRREKALAWTDPLYTFNTSCFNCHVSRLATNYDLASDTYSTTWGEPGISCETCHGPSAEHNRVMQAGIKGRSAEEMKIIIDRDLSHDQINDMCATCHAKIVPLSMDFNPGDALFDHYDLVTLENEDYYPDGRDLGENYTYTSWLMSPCLKSGKLDCRHCHTPAGRFKFTEFQGYQTCMPCHEKYVRSPEDHGHHPSGSKGNECVGCHMPKTQFAGRARTDHSMRSPSPSASLAYGSPNACNNCHTDKDAAWSDLWSRKWYKTDYQAEALRRAGLIEAARKNQWDRLPEMLAEIARADNDPVYRNSLVRLLRSCHDPRKWPVMSRAAKDTSPLVRSSAMSALGERLDRANVETLLSGAGDRSRIVRIRAAMALAGIPPKSIENPKQREALEKAVEQFKSAMNARSDDWAAYANLGDFCLGRGDFADAVKNYDIARRLEPRIIDVLMNESVAYGNMNETGRAEQCLLDALEAEPDNAAANLNMGLLLAEEGKTAEAEQALRKALSSNPQSAAASYNLGVVLAQQGKTNEAIALCRKACELQSDEAKYHQALALYLYRQGDANGAIDVLRKAMPQVASFTEGSLLLAEIYENQGQQAQAAEALRQALSVEGLSPQARDRLEKKLRSLETGKP